MLLWLPLNLNCFRSTFPLIKGQILGHLAVNVVGKRKINLTYGLLLRKNLKILGESKNLGWGHST